MLAAIDSKPVTSGEWETTTTEREKSSTTSMPQPSGLGELAATATAPAGREQGAVQRVQIGSASGADKSEMSRDGANPFMEVLTILESVSGVTFCRQCYLPGSTCRCLGGSFTASTASTTGPSWSEIADPTFGPNSASAREGARSAPPYGSLATAGSSIWDLPSVDYPRLPGATTAICQPCPPGGRASHLESQLKAIRYGNTAPPDPLRLPTPTWVPPTTQNHQRVQLPPPPPSTDSASTTDQSQQTTAADLEHEEQETQ